MDYEFLYTCDLEYLASFIKNASKEKQIEILKDKKIKDRIINESHYPFVYFVQNQSDDTILNLLDEEGLDIFASADRIVDKLNAILTSCKTCFMNVDLNVHERVMKCLCKML